MRFVDLLLGAATFLGIGLVFLSSGVYAQDTIGETNVEPYTYSGSIGFQTHAYTTTSFDDKDVEPGQTYYYSASSVDIFDVENMMSNTARFSPSLPALRSLKQVSARSVSEGIEIRWNKTMQDGAAGYRIYRRTRGASEPAQIGSTNLDETRFLDQNISGGELYWYSITVVGDTRESSASNEKSVRAN